MGATFDQQLANRIAAGRAAWPSVMVEPEVFARYLAERVANCAEPERALDVLHTTDLYLACACAGGDSNALTAFERAMRPLAERVFERMPNTAPLGDDAYQVLVSRLLVSEGGAPPRITEYSGRSTLRTWFRVAITRQTWNAARALRREVSLDDTALAMTPCPDEDPELSHLRRHFAREFAEAFASAARLLESTERNMLRHHYVDGLSIDEIGAIYRIHRMTAARRVTRARRALVLATRRLLAERLNATSSELRSALRALDGAVDVDLTLSRALRATGPR